MKRIFIIFALLFLIIVQLQAAGTFSGTVQYLLKVADKCIEENLYYEKLISLGTSTYWGDAVFIPARVLDQNLISFTEYTAGFIVIKLRIMKQPTTINLKSISLTGKVQNSQNIREVTPTVYLLSENISVSIQTFYNSIIDTFLDYVILVLCASDIDFSSDFTIYLKTATSEVLWKIQHASEIYAKLKQLIPEIK